MKNIARLGIWISIVGLLLSFGCLINIGDTATRTYSSASVDPQGNFNGMFVFPSKNFEFKIIIPEGSDAEFNIYDSQDLLGSEILPEPIFSKSLNMTESFRFIPPRRGFYVMQLINMQTESLDYAISAYQSSGLQRDFMLEGMIITSVGLLVSFFGLLCLRKPLFKQQINDKGA